VFEQPDSKRIGGAPGAGFLTELFIVGLRYPISYLISRRLCAAIPPNLRKIVWLSDPGPAVWRRWQQDARSAQAGGDRQAQASAYAYARAHATDTG
jgi:hypothetical protein